MKLSKDAIAFKHLLQLLLTKEMSQEQLAEATGLNRMTVGRYLAVLHIKPKNLVYISRYGRSRTVGPYTAFYSFGFCEADIPRPPPLPKSARDYKKKVARKLSTVRTETGLIHTTN